MTTTAHPADRVTRDPKLVATLTADELFAADIEMARRAMLLGKAGQVTKTHAAVRTALLAR